MIRTISTMLIALLVVPACEGECSLVDCGGGFAWHGHARDNHVLDDGDYTVTIDLEGSVYSSTCTVADRTECSEPERIEGATSFTVSVAPRFDDDPFVDPNNAKPTGFRVEAVEHQDDGSERGPTDVHIVLAHGEELLVEETYEVEYEREDDFNGEGCGFCDFADEYTSTF